MEISAVPSYESADRVLAEYRKAKREKVVTWYSKFLKKFFPSKKRANLILTQAMCVFFVSIFLYGMLGEAAEPGTEIFAIYYISVLACVGAKISRACKLPGLLGMMIPGFLFRNISSIHYYEDISNKTLTCMREIALAIILLRAGLELDSRLLVKLKMTVLKLTIIPCLVEAATVGIFGHYILALPWIYSIMLGFIVSSTSPEVSIPILLKLEHKGYGIEKGIPTLVMASASLDDVIAIAGFTMCFSIATSTSHIAWTIVKGPLEPFVGFTLGSLFGFVSWYLPSKDRKLGTLVYYNVFLMTSAALALMFATQLINLPGASALGCITISFVGAFAWRKNPEQYAGVYSVAEVMWNLIQPFVFASLGAEVTIESLQNSAGFGILTLFVGLTFRLFVTILICSGIGFNWREKIFVCCAWLPKATAQAAIGSQILDHARTVSDDPLLVNYATTVLNICIVSIFITAPLGSVLTTLLGPYLLHKDVIVLDSDSGLFQFVSLVPANSRRESDHLPNTEEQILSEETQSTTKL